MSFRCIRCENLKRYTIGSRVQWCLVWYPDYIEFKYFFLEMTRGAFSSMKNLGSEKVAVAEVRYLPQLLWLLRDHVVHIWFWQFMLTAYWWYSPRAKHWRTFAMCLTTPAGSSTWPGRGSWGTWRMAHACRKTFFSHRPSLSLAFDLYDLHALRHTDNAFYC